MHAALSRRSVLTLTGMAVVGSTGCLGAATAPGLVVRNAMAESVSFSVDISPALDASPVFSERGSLAGGALVTYDDPVPEPGEYIIDAAAGDRTASYEWFFSADDAVGVTLEFEPYGWSLSEARGAYL